MCLDTDTMCITLALYATTMDLNWNYQDVFNSQL